jgi:UDP-N-acetylglucosamine 2-epimerase (non-hydrolysing)
MKIINVVGARTNPIKIAPLIIEMRHRKTIEPILAHKGQHDDVKMARKFFEDFGIPEPNLSLEMGFGSHAFQTTEVMKRIEPVMGQQRSDFVLVGGDFNWRQGCGL